MLHEIRNNYISKKSKKTIISAKKALKRVKYTQKVGKIHKIKSG
jgi:hypothetical protein